MQNGSPKVSIPQQDNREIFKRCVACFNQQPTEGGAEPPNVGPRNRAWWYEAAGESGLWYYDYFIKTTMNADIAQEAIPWCNLGTLNGATVYTFWPNTAFPHDVRASWGWVIFGGVTRKTETWYKNEDTSRTLTIFLAADNGVGGTPPPTGTPFQYRIYQIDEDWDKDNLTWNNKPAKGAIIKEGTLYQNLNHWHVIDIGNIPRFAITAPVLTSNFQRYYQWQTGTNAWKNSHFIPQ